MYNPNKVDLQQWKLNSKEQNLEQPMSVLRRQILQNINTIFDFNTRDYVLLTIEQFKNGIVSLRTICNINNDRPMMLCYISGMLNYEP